MVKTVLAVLILLGAAFAQQGSNGRTYATTSNGRNYATGGSNGRAYTACSSAAGHSYSTVFPATESPISECYSWLNGHTDGTSWTDVDTTTNFAFGTEANNSAVDDDSTAIMKGTWTSGPQAAVGTVVAGTTSDTITKEIELRLNSTMTASNSTGYEAYFQGMHTTAANCQAAIVRWNGAISNFTSLSSDIGTRDCLHTGDQIRFTHKGNSLAMYLNEVQLVNTTDSTYTTGAPGMGMYLQGTSGTNDFGLSAFSATDNPILYYNSASHDVATSGTTVAATMATTTTGHTLWCTAYWGNTGKTGSVSDVANGSYTAVDSPVNGAGQLASYRTQSFYKTNITGATTPAITLTLSGGAAATDRAIGCVEISGVSSLDQHPAVAVGTGTAANSATTGTTAAANEYAVGWCVYGNSPPNGINDAASPWVGREYNGFGGNLISDRQNITQTGTFTFQTTQASGGTADFLCGINTFQ